MRQSRNLGNNTPQPMHSLSTNAVRHRNLGASGSPSSASPKNIALTINLSASKDDGTAPYNEGSGQNNNFKNGPYNSMASPKVHGRAKRREDLVRTNKNWVVLGGAAFFGFCIMGLLSSWAPLLSSTSSDGRQKIQYRSKKGRTVNKDGNEVMEVYHETKFEKGNENNIQKLDPNIETNNSIPENLPLQKEPKKKRESLELIDDDDRDRDLIVRKSPPDPDKGGKKSAAAPLPQKQVDIQKWGYFFRPRVLSCEFQLVKHDTNKERESKEVGNNYLEDGPYFTISSVHRIPTHESALLAASDRYVSLYPDDDAYMDRIRRIKKDSKKYRHSEREPFDSGTCVAQYEWQRGSFPNCNVLHEYELGALSSMYGRAMRRGLNEREGDGDEQVRYWAHGFWRDVWLTSKAFESSKEEEISVLKTLRYTHDFIDRNYDRHRKDALASERLSKSRYVVDIFAYCANSAIFEYGAAGDIDEKLFPYDSKVKKHYVANLSSLEQIDIAFQVARGIADIHDVEDNGIPSIVHTDITPSQFIYIDGNLKVNDFNRCRFMRTDTVNFSPCGFFVGANPGKFRAPEEYRYEEENEKVDIYSMGNIFYTIIVGDYPFEDVKEKEAQQRVIEGERPEIPPAILESDDIAIRAIVSAIQRCWKQRPSDRPFASEIRDELREVMNIMEKKNETYHIKNNT